MSKLGKQLGEIGSGWFNYIFESPEVEAIALPRLKICDSCPIRTNKVCDRKKSIDGVFGCGCPLEKKARSINSKCPLGKW